MAFDFIKALSDGFNVCVEIFPVFIVYVLLWMFVGQTKFITTNGFPSSHM